MTIDLHAPDAHGTGMTLQDLIYEARRRLEKLALARRVNLHALNFSRTEEISELILRELDGIPRDVLHGLLLDLLWTSADYTALREAARVIDPLNAP